MITQERPLEVPDRCVVVVDEALAPGLAANAAAVLAVTLGAEAPGLVGAAFADAAGGPHAGLVDRGLPILRSPGAALPDLRARALHAGLAVVDLPTFGQQTTDYATFCAHVAETPPEDLRYLALLVHGPKRAVNKVTGCLGLLR